VDGLDGSGKLQAYAALRAPVVQDSIRGFEIRPGLGQDLGVGLVGLLGAPMLSRMRS
jgi:hypothetical protein